MKSKFRSLFRSFSDFKPGIQFIDVMPIFQHPEELDELIDDFITCIGEQTSLSELTSVVGLESRGFLFGVLVANKLNLPFIPIRKKGRLPGKCISETYTTEYSTDSIEIQSDAPIGRTPLVVDDLLATGGTLIAAQNLLKKLHADNVISAVIFNIDNCPKLEGYDSLSQVIWMDSVED